MADKTIGELPGIAGLYDDSLIPVEQQGVASKITGEQFADFAREAAAQDVQRAIDAADAAEKSKAEAKSEANRSKTEADRAAELRESIEVEYDALHQAVEDAEAHADRSASEADRARDEAGRAGDGATLSKSWAVGGTGTRPGEDMNNSKYWADRAQAEAERAAVPPVEGVYNVILSDRATGERYALLVERGRLALLGVSDTLEATTPLLIDQTDGKAYAVVVEAGRLKIEETA